MAAGLSGFGGGDMVRRQTVVQAARDRAAACRRWDTAAHGEDVWIGGITAIAREARKEVTGNGEEGERRPHAGMVGCGRQRRREQFDGCGARPEADTA